MLGEILGFIVIIGICTAPALIAVAVRKIKDRRISK